MVKLWLVVLLPLCLYSQETQTLPSIYKEVKKETILILSDIEIRGNNKISKNQILNYTGLKYGDKIRPEKLKSLSTSLIEKLWDTNKFSEIGMDAEVIDNQTLKLVFDLTQVPIIEKVEITGVKKSLKEELKEEFSLEKGAKMNIDLSKNIENSGD